MLLFRGGPQLCFCEYFRKVLICSGPSNIFFVTYVSREPRILLLYQWLSEIRNLIKSVFQVCFLSWGGRCQDKEQKVKITAALSGSAALLKQTKPFCPCGCRQHLQKLQCQPGSRMALGSAGRDARGQGCHTAHQPHEGQAVNTQQQGFSKNCSSSLHFWGRLLPRFSKARGLESYVLLVFSLFGWFFYTKPEKGLGIGCDFLLFSQIQNLGYKQLKPQFLAHCLRPEERAIQETSVKRSCETLFHYFK